MRIKQTAWKNSVGVRVLLVWQRDCHHIKIARVLNKTETCTIYTCQREEEAGRQRRPDTKNFHSRVGTAWCEVQVLALHVRLNFVKWHVLRVHMTEALNVVLGSARWVICIQERLWNVKALKKKQTPVILDRKKEKETKLLEWHDNQENSQQRYYRAFLQQYLTMNTNGAKSDVVA